MSYKTLIIIDNTSEMTSLNQKIIKETIKSFINNINREDKVAIAVTGETAEYLTDYDDSLNTQLKTVEDIEFKDVNAPGADVLMEVLLGWKESDVAYRDILYVSCRGVAINSDYSEEELFFEVNNKQYPIYTLACSQNENTSSIKALSSLSRISGGVCVNTNDAETDAGVEKQLSDKLLQVMKEFRKLEEERIKAELESEMAEEVDDNDEESEYSELDNDEDELEEITEENELEEYYSEAKVSSGNVIYELPDESAGISIETFVYPCLAIVLIAIIVAVSMFLRNEKLKKEEDKFNRDRNENKQRNTEYEPFAKACESETVCLMANNYEDEDTGTRLLFQTKEGVEITLEDRSNPTKFFRTCVRDSIVIGRNEKICDIPITYDDSISSRHCELFQRDGNLYCRDLGSSNGTMINQQKVYQEIRVESGDILRIGRISFFVQIVGDKYE